MHGTVEVWRQLEAWFQEQHATMPEHGTFGTVEDRLQFKELLDDYVTTETMVKAIVQSAISAVSAPRLSGTRMPIDSTMMAQ